MQKTNSEIVVEALMMGMEVTIGGRTFRLFRNGEEVPLCNGSSGTAESPWLGMRMSQNDKPVYLGADFQFDHFITMVEKDLGEADRVCLAAAITLTKSKREQMRR